MNTIGLFRITERIEYAENAAICGAPEQLINSFKKSKEAYIYEQVKQLQAECKQVIDEYEKELNTASQTNSSNAIQSITFSY